LIALSGSKHVEFLLEKGLIKSSPSKALNRAYAREFLRPAKSQNLVWSSSYEQIPEGLSNPSVSQLHGMMRIFIERDAQDHFLTKVIKEIPDALDRTRAELSIKDHPGLERINLKAAAMLNERLMKMGYDPIDFPKSGVALEDLKEKILLRTDSTIPIESSIVEDLEENSPDLLIEMDRAIRQVHTSLSAKEELEDEKEKLDSASKGASEKDTRL
jgi:hypothetical protein